MTPEANFEDLIEDLSAEDLALLNEDENIDLAEGTDKIKQIDDAIARHKILLAKARKDKNAEAVKTHEEFIAKLDKKKTSAAGGAALTEAFGKKDDEDEDEEDDTEGDDDKKGKKKDEDEDEEDDKSKDESVDYSADIAVLVESDANLTEDFKQKATTIFEAAVTQKVNAEKKTLTEAFEAKSALLSEEYEAKLVTESAAHFDFLVKKVDDYLTEAVEGWIAENKVAIDSGLRTEIAESFIKSLKGVFTEHYIEVPETKTDLVDQLSTELTTLKESFQAKEDEAKLLAESVETLTRAKILSEESSSLIDTQAVKLLELVEDVEFVSEEAFRKKVTTIKESFFAAGNKPAGKSTPTLTQVGKPGVIAEDVEVFTPTGGGSGSPLMDSVLSVMKQMQKNQ